MRCCVIVENCDLRNFPETISRSFLSTIFIVPFSRALHFSRLCARSTFIRSDARWDSLTYERHCQPFAPFVSSWLWSPVCWHAWLTRVGSLRFLFPSVSPPPALAQFLPRYLWSVCSVSQARILENGTERTVDGSSTWLARSRNGCALVHSPSTFWPSPRNFGMSKLSIRR